MSTPSRAEIAIADRPTLIREAFTIEYLTIAWMVIEAAVAIASGLEAASLTLLAFGRQSDRAGFSERLGLATEGRASTRTLVRRKRGTQSSSDRWSPAVCTCHLCRGCRRLEIVDAARSRVLSNWPCRECSGHADHVCPCSAQTASRGGARKPCAARRCGREHHLRLALARRGCCPPGTAHHRRLVGGRRRFTRHRLASCPRRPRGLARRGVL